MEPFVPQIRAVEGAAVSTTGPSWLISGSLHLSHVEFLQEAKQMFAINPAAPSVLEFYSYGL